MSKVEQRVRNDRRVHSIFDERTSGDGIWVYLKDGFNFEGCSAVHEDSWTQCEKALRTVVEGDCY